MLLPPEQSGKVTQATMNTAMANAAPGRARVESYCRGLYRLPVVHHQECESAGTQTGKGFVGATGQNDRDARTEYNTCKFRPREIFELLRQHVSSLQIRYHKDVSLPGDRRD